MRLPHALVHEAHSVLDLFEGFVCVETASLVLDVGGVECHHLVADVNAVAESHLVNLVAFWFPHTVEFAHTKHPISQTLFGFAAPNSGKRTRTTL